jgi:transcriptional regulator with XRE-family HTH domain
MEIGNKIHQLRKLSGMTQEQLSEKLNVSRQTISKWESGGTSPDLESIVKISKLFHVSLDDLLMEENASVTNQNDEHLTLEDLITINLHNRKMTLLLISGLIFILVGILNFAYVMALESTTLSTQYMLYRYIVTGRYESAPIDYTRFMIPSIFASAIGLLLCLFYIFKNRKKGG